MDLAVTDPRKWHGNVVKLLVNSVAVALLAAVCTGCASYGGGGALDGAFGSNDSYVTPRSKWAANRVSDFMDIIHAGVGVSSENKITGALPPSFGLYVEATPVLTLGVIEHHGVTAEWEGRGLGAYPESRSMRGFGPYQSWQIYQADGVESFYKNSARSAAWSDRMAGDMASSFLGRCGDWIKDKNYEGRYTPAKELIHKDKVRHSTAFGVPRGWQTWGYVGVQAGLCDPFLTHLGVSARAGIDFSEISDFVLGFLFIDFKQDDRRDNE